MLSSDEESEREGLDDKDEGEIVTVEMVHKWSQRLKNVSTCISHDHYVRLCTSHDRHVLLCTSHVNYMILCTS